MSLNEPATYAQAVALEGERRDFAFLPLSISICGIDCPQLTLEKLLLLYAIESPFVCGGRQDGASIAQALWLISDHYTPSAADRSAFIALVGELPAAQLFAELENYFDAALMDHPDGGGGESYTSLAASYVHIMGREYGWTRAETMASPVAILFQMLRLIQQDRNAGAGLDKRTLGNRLSGPFKWAPLAAEKARIDAENSK